MPFYRCIAPAGSIRADGRRAIAREFTRIHSELTGAPSTFVHVHFVEIHPGTSSDVESYEIHGTIRAGRSADVTSQLARELTRTFSELANAEPGTVNLSLNEVPASWIMEAGEIAPEPGAEAEWLERHPR